MADINHEIKIQAPPEEIFKALSNLEALKSWHTAHIDGGANLGEVLKFSGLEKPTFLWKVVGFEPNKMITWECIEGPGDSIGTKSIYTLSSTADNQTLVELSHTSWPDQEGNFRKCNTLWGILLHHLKKYVETKKKDPAIL